MIRSIYKSFKYAFEGLWHCIKYERNFRIHLTALVYVMIFAVLYKLDGLGFAALFSVFSLVLFAEAANTAIEALVDMSKNNYNYLAKITKDIAAGAVLITSVFAVCAGVALFHDINRIITVFSLFYTYPIYLLPILLLTILSVFFIKGVKK